MVFMDTCLKHQAVKQDTVNQNTEKKNSLKKAPVKGDSDRKSNPAQETAICHGAGPCAVIAGPGSGKTFVLVKRIQYLIRSLEVLPSSILVLTFSRAAAAEMRSRHMAQGGAAEVVFGTFHAVFFRILQESSHGRLCMVEPAVKRNYLRRLCEDRPSFLPEKMTPEELQQLISRSKNGLPCPRQPWLPGLVRVYDAYLQNRGCLDFDDMILKCRALLTENPEILNLWRSRFKWILVDEFQDVSRTQYELLRLLAAPLNNLFVVGDDDQSIYGFRGADPGTVQRFLQDYCVGAKICSKEEASERSAALPGKQIFLTTNYRCSRSVLSAGSKLIRENKNRIDKTFQAGSPEKGAFFLRPFSDPGAEYAFLASTLKSMEPERLSRSAVIFRTHTGASAFLSVLSKNGIPFMAEGTKTRMKQVPSSRTQILKDLCAYYRCALRLEKDRTGLYARKDTADLRQGLIRIMNRPERYLSGFFIPRENLSRQEMLARAGFEKDAAQELFEDLDLLSSLSPVYSLRYLFDSVGYRSFAQESYKNAGDILSELLHEAKEYSDPLDWLSRLEELSAREERKTGTENTKKAADPASNTDHAQKTGVNIITMHACKGLEFEEVFIPDLNEGNIPSRKAWSEEEIEEERRLLYVAMTRAKKSLTICFLEGTPDRPAAPSRFLRPFIHSAAGS